MPLLFEGFDESDDAEFVFWIFLVDFSENVDLLVCTCDVPSQVFQDFNSMYFVFLLSF